MLDLSCMRQARLGNQVYTVLGPLYYYIFDDGLTGSGAVYDMQKPHVRCSDSISTSEEAQNSFQQTNVNTSLINYV